MHAGSKFRAEFHSCARWWRYGLACPFGKEDFDFEDNAPDEDAPDPRGVPALLGAGRRARGSSLSALEEAERIVAAAADAVPVGARGRSLGEALRGPAVAAGTAAAAGVAIKGVAAGIRRGGFGGLHFPAVFSPERVVRPAR